MEITNATRSMFLNCRTMALVLFLSLGVLVGLSALAWWAMSQVGADAARVWALLATILLLPVAVVFYRLGKGEARSHIAGMEDGISRVMQATSDTLKVAGGVADLRTTSAASMRRVMQESPPEALIELPPAEGSYRLLQAQTGESVIEME